MKCLVKNCGKTNFKFRKLITFHSIPKHAHKKWCEILNINVEWNRNLKICSVHFNENDFNRTGYIVRLKPGVVPSLALSTSAEITTVNLDIDATQREITEPRLGPSYADDKPTHVDIKPTLDPSLIADYDLTHVEDIKPTPDPSLIADYDLTHVEDIKPTPDPSLIADYDLTHVEDIKPTPDPSLIADYDLTHVEDIKPTPSGPSHAEDVDIILQKMSSISPTTSEDLSTFKLPHQSNTGSQPKKRKRITSNKSTSASHSSSSEHRKRKKFISVIHNYCAPNTPRKTMRMEKQKVIQYRKRLYTSKKTINRLRRKIVSLKNIIRQLREQRIISENAEDH